MLIEALAAMIIGQAVPPSQQAALDAAQAAGDAAAAAAGPDDEAARYARAVDEAVAQVLADRAAQTEDVEDRYLDAVVKVASLCAWVIVAQQEMQMARLPSAPDLRLRNAIASLDQAERLCLR